MLNSLPRSARRARESVLAGIEAIENQYERRGAMTSIPTGLRPLDRKMDGGLRTGEMIVIAGRPDMGKTALALSIVEHAVIDRRLPTVIFALDTSVAGTAQRLLCSRARVDRMQVREGRLTGLAIHRLREAAVCFAESPLLIDEATALTMQELGQRMRYYVQAHGVKLAIVDYLHLLRSDDNQARTDRRAGVAALSSQIRSLARELKIPVVVLCPLNRKLENRSDYRPRLGDLRGSRLIAQDADTVILMFREQYYASNRAEMRRAKGKITAIIAKQPQGAAGNVTFRFDERCGCFHEIS